MFPELSMISLPNRQRQWNGSNLIILSIWLLGFFFFPTLIIFIFPGILLLLWPRLKKISLPEAVGYILVLSLSVWICSFNLLKFIPLSFTNLVYGLSFLSVFLLFIFNRSSWPLKPIHIKDVIILGSFCLFTVLFLRIYSLQLAPAGADMTTHAYTAKVIIDQNGYPVTYEPIVPVKQFGSGYIGMSTLIAGVTLLNHLPIYRNALMIELIVFPLLAMALFNLLKNFYNLGASSITSIIIFFISREFNDYLTWGGIPTLWALVFLVFGVSFLLHNFSLKSVMITSLYFSSATISHQMVPVISIYLLIPVFIYLFFKKIHTVPALLVIGIIMMFFNLPFLLTFRIPSSETLNWIKNWQKEMDWVKMEPNSYGLFLQTLEYLRLQFGNLLFTTTLIGIFSAIYLKSKGYIWFVVAFIVGLVLIFNARVWFLPLSALVYLDRIPTVLLVFCSYFVALVIQKLLNLFQSISHSSQRYLLLLFSLILVPFFVFQIEKIVTTNYLAVQNESGKNTLLTQADLEVFSCLVQKTTIYDVVENNYGDAGLWIPAIVGRRINNYDMMPHHLEEITKRQTEISPNYVFIGSKPVYPNKVNLNSVNYIANPNYQPVCQSGGAKLFRRL